MKIQEGTWERSRKKSLLYSQVLERQSLVAREEATMERSPRESGHNQIGGEQGGVGPVGRCFYWSSRRAHSTG